MSHTQILCPACQGLDWVRDGFRIRLLEDGSLQSRRITAPGDGIEPWVCANCGYRVVAWDALSARLNGARLEVEGTLR